MTVTRQVLADPDAGERLADDAAGERRGGPVGAARAHSHRRQPQAAPVERTLYWRMKSNGQAALRQGDWKYLKLGAKEHLFNVAKDPRERADLLAEEPQRAEALKALYDRWNSQMLPYPLQSFSENVKDRYPDRY